MKQIIQKLHKDGHIFIINCILVCTLLGFYGCKPDNTSDNNKPQDSVKTKVKPKNDSLSRKIGIEITGKEFQHGDPKDPNDKKDYNAIIYKMTNKTDKDIRQ